MRTRFKSYTTDVFPEPPITEISYDGLTTAVPPVTHDRTDKRSMTDLTRQEMTAALGQNKAEVDARLANFDASIKTGFSELRAEFASMRTEMAKQSGDMRTEMANVRAETHKGTVDIIKWVIGTILAVALATVSILTFVINNVTPKTPAPATAPAPVVIYAQPGPTPQAPAPAPPPAK